MAHGQVFGSIEWPFTAVSALLYGILLFTIGLQKLLAWLYTKRDGSIERQQMFKFGTSTVTPDARPSNAPQRPQPEDEVATPLNPAEHVKEPTVRHEEEDSVVRAPASGVSWEDDSVLPSSVPSDAEAILHGTTPRSPRPLQPIKLPPSLENEVEEKSSEAPGSGNKANAAVTAKGRTPPLTDKKQGHPPNKGTGHGVRKGSKSHPNANGKKKDGPYTSTGPFTASARSKPVKRTGGQVVHGKLQRRKTLAKAKEERKRITKKTLRGENHQNRFEKPVDKRLRRMPTPKQSLKEISKKHNQRIEEVRVFVSSTFVDMFEERETLVKRVFPQLRLECASKGVPFTEIDLRTGVTKEQGETGETVSICLNEIERCRPYFIGLLGERYGWSARTELPEPWKGNNDAIKRSFELAISRNSDLKWIRKYSDRSVTELEIRHAVLNDVSRATRSFFYMRNPHYSESVEESKRAGFMSEDSECARKLGDLKNELRACGRPVRQYDVPTDIATLVTDDLVRCIQSDLPESVSDDPLDYEALAHEAFMLNRTRIHVGHTEELQALNDFANMSLTNTTSNATNGGERSGEDESRPMAVIGSSGCGKTALLCQWASQKLEDPSFDFVLGHFVGSSEASANHFSMLRRFMGEMKRTFDLSNEIPTSTQDFYNAFENFIRLVADRARILLIFDAVNQLEEYEGVHTLQWLPETLPSSVVAIVSTIPDTRTHKEMQRRQMTCLDVSPLTLDQKGEIVVSYLKNFNKSLSDDQLEIVVNAEQTASPLFLVTVLNEIRIYGTYETFTEVIQTYTRCSSIPELFEMILARLEADYDVHTDTVQDDQHDITITASELTSPVAVEAALSAKPRGTPCLVKSVLGAIYLLMFGLADYEAVEISGRPMALLAPLLSALSGILIKRSGLYTFFHDQPRIAVKKKYFGEDSSNYESLSDLKRYFSKLPDEDERKLKEFPRILMLLDEKQSLHSYLSSLVVFVTLYNEDKFDFLRYWRGAGGYSHIRSTYLPAIDAIDDENDRVDMYLLLSQLLTDVGLGYLGEPPLRACVDILKTKINNAATTDEERREYELGLASVYVKLCEYTLWPENILKCKEAIDMRTRLLGVDTRTGEAWEKLAVVQEKWKRYALVIPSLEKARSIYVETCGVESVEYANVQWRESNVFFRRGMKTRCVPLLESAMAIFKRELGQWHPSLGEISINLALLNSWVAGLSWWNRDELKRAEKHYIDARKIFEATVGRPHPFYIKAACGVAWAYSQTGRLKQALRIYRGLLTTTNGQTLVGKFQLVIICLRIVRDTLYSPWKKQIMAMAALLSIAITIALTVDEMTEEYSNVTHQVVMLGMVTGFWLGLLRGGKLHLLFYPIMILCYYLILFRVSVVYGRNISITIGVAFGVPMALMGLTMSLVYAIREAVELSVLAFQFSGMVAIAVVYLTYLGFDWYTLLNSDTIEDSFFDQHEHLVQDMHYAFIIHGCISATAGFAMAYVMHKRITTLNSELDCLRHDPSNHIRHSHERDGMTRYMSYASHSQADGSPSTSERKLRSEVIRE